MKLFDLKTVYQFIPKKHAHKESLRDRPRSVQPRVTQKHKGSYVRVCSKCGRFKTARQIGAALMETRTKTTSVATLKDHLTAVGLQGGIAARISLLRPFNKTKRLARIG